MGSKEIRANSFLFEEFLHVGKKLLKMFAEPFWEEVFWGLPHRPDKEFRWWVVYVGEEEPRPEVSLKTG